MKTTSWMDAAAWLGCGLLALTTAGCPTTQAPAVAPPCDGPPAMKPVHGGPDGFPMPGMILGKDGQLVTDLYVQFAQAKVTGATDNDGKPVETIWTRAYGTEPANPAEPLDEVPGPTMVYHPGDWLQITLHNQLNRAANPWLADFERNVPTDSQDDIAEHVPHEVNIPHNADNTNLHVHGMHVDPKQDNVTIVLLPEDSDPSRVAPDLQSLIPDIDRWWEWEYGYRVPADHLPGTHWYHAHKHGATSTHVENGMAGTLLVRPQEDEDDLVPGLWSDNPDETHDRVMMLQEIANYGVQAGTADAHHRPDLAPARQASKTDQLTTQWPDITVNGVHQPTLTLAPGQTERWRFIDAGANHRTASYLWVGGLTPPENISDAMKATLEGIEDFETAKPFLTIGSDAKFPEPFQVALTPFPGRVELVALDGVTLSQAIDISQDKPVLLGPGNRADLYVQPNPDATGSWYVVKNFNVAPPQAELAKNPNYGSLFEGEAGYWRYQALTTVAGGTDVVNGTGTPGTEGFTPFTSFGALPTDPYALGTDFTGFQKSWPKKVTVEGAIEGKPVQTSLAPLLKGSPSGNGVSIVPTSGPSFEFPGLGWVPTGGGGIVDAQPLVTIQIEGDPVESPPPPSNERLSQYSPTTADPSGTKLQKVGPDGALVPGIPSYVAPISDADIVGSQVIVFDKSGIQFDYQPPQEGAASTSMNQFSLNGRQFNVMDFVGNPHANMMIGKPVPPSIEDPFHAGRVLGTYDFAAAGGFTNRVTIGKKDVAFFTNPGYYLPVVKEGSYFTYDYGAAKKPPTYTDITGLPSAHQPEATTAEEWLLINNSPIFHPFHIHISPFLIKEVGQVSYDAEGKAWSIDTLKADDPLGYMLDNWWDVVIIPPQGYVKLRLWLNIPDQKPVDPADPRSGFQVTENANVYGQWVYHCHILRHEDRGMMMMVNVKPKAE